MTFFYDKIDETQKYEMKPCTWCGKDTVHRVRKRVGQRKGQGGAFIKRIAYRCRTCNKVTRK